MQERESVLITGANGLLGYELAKKIRHEYTVYGIVRNLSYDILEGVEYYSCDFSRELATDILPSRISTVIHLAQSNKFRDFPDNSLDIFNVNVRATAILIDYAYRVKAKRFIYASSGGLYDNVNDILTENSPILSNAKLGYYLGSKMCSEVLIQSYVKYMHINILRPFFMYGKRQKRSMFIPRIIDNVKFQKPIYLQGEEGLKVNPVHVSDVVTTIESVLKQESSFVINVAGDEILTLKEISKIISDKLSIDPCFEYINECAKDYVADISLMKSLLNKELTRFADGVNDVL
jgi:nucleoside-diphosphate-sugar epimerase